MLWAIIVGVSVGCGVWPLADSMPRYLTASVFFVIAIVAAGGHLG